MKPVEYMVDRHRRTCEIGSLLIQHGTHPSRCAFVHAAKERTGMSHLDPERLACVDRGVAQVQGDDHRASSEATAVAST